MSIAAQTPARTHRGDDVPWNPNLPNKLQFVSSTQMKQFRECHRKWFFATQCNAVQKQTAAMALGQEVHDILEHYAKHGKFPTEKVEDSRDDPDFQTKLLIAAEALQYLPEWKQDWMPETNIGIAKGSVLNLAGIPFVSYIDLIVPPRLLPFPATGSPFAREYTTPLVVDYKTTSALKYAKIEQELRHDIQAVGYARWAADFFYQPNWSDLGAAANLPIDVLFPWLLTRRTKKGPNSAKTEVHFLLHELVDPWEEFDQDASAMLALARQAEQGLAAKDVEPNWNSCEAWGGCPHRATCNKYSAQALSASFDAQLVQLKREKGGDMFGTHENKVPIGRAFEDLDAQLKVRAALSSLFEPHKSVVTPVNATGFDLLIDIAPLKAQPGEPTVLLEEYLAPLAAKVVAQWNAAKSTDFVDMMEFPFAGWKGPFRALLLQYPPSGIVLAKSMSDVSNAAIEVLKPMARSVWQGYR